MVKINLNIPNRTLYTVLGLIILVALAVGVNAFTTDGSGNPSVMGHSDDEIDFVVNNKEHPQIQIIDDNENFKTIEFRDSTNNKAWQISYRQDYNEGTRGQFPGNPEDADQAGTLQIYRYSEDNGWQAFLTLTQTGYLVLDGLKGRCSPGSTLKLGSDYEITC